MKKIADSELILNPDGSIYHLNLHPEQISDTILLVGDPHRVQEISSHFSSIEHQTHNREFVTHTGYYKGKRITALSTGIGTDNIDIVLNELDALVNIDLQTREIKENKTTLRIIRIGTSGALQHDIPVGSVVMSQYGLGLDGLLNFYNAPTHIFEEEITEAFIAHTGWSKQLARPYTIKASEPLMKKLDRGYIKGITATAPGFYGPQGRQLRIEPVDMMMNEKLHAFEFRGSRITNFEMETSALYGLSALLGHHAVTLCSIIANRFTKAFSSNYKPAMEKLIVDVLEEL